MAYNPYQIIDPVATPVINTPAPISNTTPEQSIDDKQSMDALNKFITQGSQVKSTDTGDIYNTSERARYNDPKLGFLLSRDNENYYEQNQSKWGMFSNMFKQALAINNAQYINTMATTFDFNLSNDLDKEAVANMHNTMQQSMNENPVYKSSEDTWTAGFQNFIGETIPQIGFMTGTAGAILTQELALQGAAMALDATGVGIPAGVSAHIAGVGKGVKTFNDAYKAWSGFKALKTTAQLLKGARGVKAIELLGITGKVAKAAYMSHIAASSEAAVEGYDAKLKAQDYWSTVAQKEIDSKGSTDLSYEEIERRGNEVGYKVLYDNYKMLIATNAVALAQWAPGVKAAVNSVQRTLFGTGVKLGENALFELGNKTILGRIKNWTNFVASPLIEGMEEYNQGVIQEGVYNYFKDKYDPDRAGTSRSLADYYGDIWKDRWSDPEALKEFASGALIGSLGSVGGAFKNTVGDRLAKRLDGTKAGRFIPTSDKYRLTKQLEGINKAYSESGLNQEAFLNHMFTSVLEKQKAIDNGDLKTAKDIEDSQKIAFSKFIIKNGAFDLFTESLNNIGNLTKEEFISQYGIDTTIMDPETLNNFDPKILVNQTIKNLSQYKKIVENTTAFVNNRNNFSQLSDVSPQDLVSRKNRINFLGYTKSENPFLAKMASAQEDAIFVLADLVMQAENSANRFKELESNISQKIPFLSSISTNEFFNDLARENAIKSYTEELESLKAISTDPAAMLTNAIRISELNSKLDILNRLKNFSTNFTPTAEDNTATVGAPSNFNLFSRLSSTGRITKSGVKSKVQNRNRTDKNYESVRTLFQEYMDLEAKLTEQGNLSINDMEEVWLESLDLLSLYDENQNLLRTYNKILNPSAFSDFTSTIADFKDKADRLLEEEAKNEELKIAVAQREAELKEEERLRKEQEAMAQTQNNSASTSTQQPTTNTSISPEHQAVIDKLDTISKDLMSRGRSEEDADAIALQSLTPEELQILRDGYTSRNNPSTTTEEVDNNELEENSPTIETMDDNIESVEASKSVITEISADRIKELAREAENGNALDFLQEFNKDFNENCK